MTAPVGPPMAYRRLGLLMESETQTSATVTATLQSVRWEAVFAAAEGFGLGGGFGLEVPGGAPVEIGGDGDGAEDVGLGWRDVVIGDGGAFVAGPDGDVVASGVGGAGADDGAGLGVGGGGRKRARAEEREEQPGEGCSAHGDSFRCGMGAREAGRSVAAGVGGREWEFHPTHDDVAVMNGAPESWAGMRRRRALGMRVTVMGVVPRLSPSAWTCTRAVWPALQV